MGKIVGIDLGTTNSVVCVMEGKEVKVIPNKHGSNLTPSVVGFPESGDRLVGQLAKRQAIVNPKNTIYSIKRFMGRRHSEVGQEEKLVPYEVVGGADEPVRVRIRGKDYTPQEISAMVLADLKETAEAYLGEKVTEAVITCPAYFNDSQRQATKEAGRIAGFDVKRVFNEPTAAAMAFGMDKKRGVRKIAIYDLGGGTFDISILEADNEVIQVLSTNGNTHLGGDDFDQRLIEYIASEFQKQSGMDLRKDPMALQRLREACEKAKCELSSMTETEINLPFIAQDASRSPVHLTQRITRSKFEQLVGDLLESSLQPCQAALTDAKLKAKDIDEVVLVGGSTRIPKVQQLVKEFFGREPNRSVNPDEVVAVGAAIQAAVLGGEMKEILLLDVTPLTLGIKVEGGLMVPLIKRNTTIPTEQSQSFSTAAENQPGVTVEVFQGERPMAEDNRRLGNFDLQGIPPAPRGVPQIEVKFKLDANGILNVSAKDKGTGKEQQITITASTGLDDKQIEKMVKDAEAYADKDKERKELAEARNQADHVVYATEKALKDYGDKISASEKEKVEKALENLRKAKDGDKADEIKRATEAVTQASHEFSKHLYEEAAKKQAAAGDGTQTGPSNGGAEAPRAASGAGSGKEGDEKIIDADFKTK
ncbi:MAG TPA: molecular chaperone DnaK [Planctomycetota bacterium]|nr:molecular chaperone DnaK [Planctomycetota bacterium]